MKYILRLIALPFALMVWIIFSIYSSLKGIVLLSYNFFVYGGEQITHNSKTNRNTIFEVYEKLEQMELNSKVDPRSQCNHVWEQEVDYGSTTSLPRKKCVICGVQLNTNHFTQ
jgi:hypothetical protein